MNTLQTLEFHQILQDLTSCCKTYLGKQQVSQLTPSYKKEEVLILLQETEQAFYFIDRKGNLPIADFSDITIWLKLLASQSSLSTTALLQVTTILKIAKELKHYFFESETIDLSDFPLLEPYFSALYSNLEIEKKIFSSILDEETIDDKASPKLSSLRRNRKKLEDGMKEALNKIIHSSTYSKYIMEPIITIRNDRYVIPIKEEYRNEIKGFIHDVSASGSSVFIEPLSVFELNNKINQLKIEENIEIEKILQALSSLLFPYVLELEENLKLIQALDFIFAKATYAKQIEGIFPTLNEEKQIHLIGARHPFIPKKMVVPIDLSIGKDYTSLIITGPNTGGKTVALKTVGLLTLMACSGLAIPAKQGSSIYVFDHVFADIGDEQSILESLSTFSAHMSSIVEITKKATSESLILLDELGSGTDPIEGSSLAISILEYFYLKGTLTLTTTHYEEVKQYALLSNGFENASFEFDIELLKPTYHLLIGVPGKSNAFAISKRLGLEERILKRAQEFQKEDYFQLEDLLKNIYDDKIKMEKQKEEVEKNLHQVEQLRKTLEKENLQKEQKEKEQIEKAKLQARDILLSAKEEANEILKKLEHTTSTSEANQLRETLTSSLKSLYHDKSKTDHVSASITSIQKSDLKMGDKVTLSTFSEPATIVSLSGKPSQAQVQVGNAKMTIKIADITQILSPTSPTSPSTTYRSTSHDKAKVVSTEINVIGQAVDEACFVIDKYLDDCALAKLETVRIVHGKGTGKLREGIHSFLRTHPHVKTFRLGTFGEGEMGVTVVTLK